MDLIYTDTKGKELGVVYTTLDMEIGEEATNDFEIPESRMLRQSRTGMSMKEFLILDHLFLKLAHSWQQNWYQITKSKSETEYW